MPMRRPSFQELLQCLLESFSLSYQSEKIDTLALILTQHRADTLHDVYSSNVQPSLAASPHSLPHSPVEGWGIDEETT